MGLHIMIYGLGLYLEAVYNGALIVYYSMYPITIYYTTQIKWGQTPFLCNAALALHVAIFFFDSIKFFTIKMKYAQIIMNAFVLFLTIAVACVETVAAADVNHLYVFAGISYASIIWVILSLIMPPYTKRNFMTNLCTFCCMQYQDDINKKKRVIYDKRGEVIVKDTECMQECKGCCTQVDDESDKPKARRRPISYVE